jgi:6-phosphogluconate dehydrogenase
MVPAGVAGRTIQELASCMDTGDTIIDGGNSYYRDDILRAKALEQSGIHYVDCGTSGGVFGLERGYCLMIGGEPAIVKHLDPLFRSIAPGVKAAPRTPGRKNTPGSAEHGYLHCGPTGAGHFVKMVHNGIEYGLMAAYAEGLKSGRPTPERKRAMDPKLAAAQPVYQTRHGPREISVWRGQRDRFRGCWATAASARRRPKEMPAACRILAKGAGRYGRHRQSVRSVLSAALYDASARAAVRISAVCVANQFGRHDEEGESWNGERQRGVRLMESAKKAARRPRALVLFGVTGDRSQENLSRALCDGEARRSRAGGQVTSRSEAAQLASR